MRAKHTLGPSLSIQCLLALGHLPVLIFSLHILFSLCLDTTTVVGDVLGAGETEVRNNMISPLEETGSVEEGGHKIRKITMP